MRNTYIYTYDACVILTYTYDACVRIYIYIYIYICVIHTYTYITDVTKAQARVFVARDVED